MASDQQTTTQRASDDEPLPDEAGAEATRSDVSTTQADESTLRELAAIGEDLLGTLRESLAVARTEARLFVSTVTLVVTAAVIAAVLLAGAWMSLVAAMALGLNALGVPGWLAALLVTVALAACAVFLFMWIRKLTTDLTFFRTRQVAEDLRQGRPGDRHEHDRQA